MKNTLGRKLLSTGFVLALAFAPPVNAWVVFDPTHHGATIAEGAKRAAEAARQLQTEINQYQQMVRDGLALADPVFKPLGDTFRSLYQIHMQSQNLMYRARNIDSMFGMTYPSYYTWLGTMGQGRPMRDTMRERYSAWSDKGYENTRTAMLGAGLQVDGMESEHAILESLVTQSNRAGGQMQAIQAANQIAANQAEQLQNLRLLIAQQNTLHANYMAHRIEQETFDNAFRQSWSNARPNNTPGANF